LVRGNDEAVKERLLRIVPAGSSRSILENEIRKRQWKHVRWDDRVFPIGSPHYFDDHGRACRYRGGPSVTVVVAEYRTPFTTTVQTAWLFNKQNGVATVCVRRTTEAL